MVYLVSRMKKNKTLKVVRAFVADNWKMGVLIAIGAAFASSLLLLKLGSLVHGLSESEFALQQQIASNGLSIGSIARDPLFLPYYLALYLLQLTPFGGPAAIRSISALFGILGAAGFFYILRNWYTARIAFFGTLLLATSAWFLHTARYASPNATYLLLPLLIAGVIALQSKARAKRAMLAVIIFGFSSVYIPGVLWFILPAIILQRHTIIKGLKSQPTWFNALVAVLSIVMLVPLLIMLIKPASDSTALHNLLQLFGLPIALPEPSTILSNIGNTFSQIFLSSNAGPIFTVGNLAWLDICTTALVTMGIYQFGKHYKLARTKLITVVAVIGVVLIALGGPVSIVLLLPFLYLFAVEGLKWLLDVWLSIFPRNPLARGFGVAMIVILITAVAIYQTNRYFLAWGQAPETHAVFNKLP